MTTTEAGDCNAPKIALRQVAARRASDDGLWCIRWRVENSSRHLIQLASVRFPHGQFKSSELRFDSVIGLDFGEHAEFEASVACVAEPGAIVENAFSIFSAVWRDQPWRIFVRLRVVVDLEGKPTAISESITTQQVGFSTAAETEG